MKRLLTTMLCSLVGINTMLMADSARPRLVVNIVVEQLRTDYIEHLRQHFGRKGFNMLIDKGIYLRDVNFPGASPDAVSATAVALTGSGPASSGITAAEIYDRDKRSARPVLAAPGGNSYTPENLLLSTISDEVAIDGIGLGAIYSVAVDPQQAVLMAGHAGTSAVWLDAETGRWATSSWYKELPLPVSILNRTASPAARLDTMSWQPLLKLDSYPGIPAQKRHYAFRYTFPTSDRDAYRRWSASPMANREVTDIALSYLKQLRLGNRGDAIDMLGIAYTAAPFKYVKDGDYRLELEDTYIRLDRQLERLIDAIDAGPGLDNTVIYLTSTGYYDDAASDDAKYRLPGGNFSKKRALSLLNSFLSARYGNGDYVETFFGPQIYLDRRTLDARRLDEREVASAARDFLSRMSGVRNAYTLSDILNAGTPATASLRSSIDAVRCGDIYIEYQPGWTVTDDCIYPAQAKPVRASMVSTPAFILSPGAAPVKVSAPVDARQLAPTVTQILRIRSPNGAQAKPLLF